LCKRLFPAVAASRLTVLLYSTYTLHESTTAHADMKANNATGKLVVLLVPGTSQEISILLLGRDGRRSPVAVTGVRFARNPCNRRHVGDTPHRCCWAFTINR
jgi:hypothetical protein